MSVSYQLFLHPAGYNALMDTAPMQTEDAPGLLTLDPWLTPYADALRHRQRHFEAVQAAINQVGGLSGPISRGFEYFGLTRGEQNGELGVWYREWAPGAHALALTGDFNDWNRESHPLGRDTFGVWSLFLPDRYYAQRLTHGSRVKVFVQADGGGRDRIPAYIRRVVQDPVTQDFAGQVWLPPTPYAFQHPAPSDAHGGLKIYEAHVGMAREEERIGTFAEFTQDILPRIAALGYSAVQLMAVAEHPYYGSFGYHVSSFYAVSSRFGTPEDLKHLVDTAHGLGLRVLLDLVHSHAVKNVREGLNRFDGTDFQYFHGGPRGEHPAWDSLVFDYSKFEVQRLLLSNVRFWLEEFRFDGLRFDGVTSMLYKDHGFQREFSNYGDYFGPNIDDDALVYLQTANTLAHTIRPEIVTVAEDVSGMPGVARPVAEGGLGFQYRLAMGVPDFWTALVTTTPDEQWPLTKLWHELTNRRPGEARVGYAESHDQSLVGDKTLAFQLMDAAMYHGMSKGSSNVVVDRGIALLKLIKLLTFSLAGEAWLNFLGNEFGHPEWVDFPREGNGYSYAHARRQWSLADDPALRYQDLNAFEPALMALDTNYGLLTDPLTEQLALHEDTRQIVYRRGPLVFAVNLHPTESYADLRVPVPDAASAYRVVLDTDAAPYGGWGRVAPDTVYPVQPVPMYGRAQSLQLYLPSRSAQVLAPVSLGE